MRRDLQTQSIGLPLPANLSVVLRAGFESLMNADLDLLHRMDRDNPYRRHVLNRIARLRLDIADLEQDA